MGVFMTGPTAAESINYVDYLESTGTQYIDTGVCPDQDTRVVMRVQCSTTNGAALFGAATTYKSNGYECFTHLLVFGGASYSGVLYSDDFVDVDFSADGCFRDGSEIATFSAAAFSAPHDLLLLARWRDDGIGETAAAKIASCQIYQGGTLVRDFRPCYGPDGVACLYDEVSKSYFYNAGTGEFSAGYDAADEPGVIAGVTWTYLESGSFTAPVTGSYQVEMHGGGGGGAGMNYYGQPYCASGGGSGELVTVQLTAGDTVSITIGAGGTGAEASPGYWAVAGDGGATAFGTYSVNGGGAGRVDWDVDAGPLTSSGSGQGSLASSGSTGIDVASVPGGKGNRYNTAQTYGDGGAGTVSSGNNKGRTGAVIVTYLGVS